MLALKSNKGISLIEIVCSFAIVFIFLSTAFTINSISLHLKKRNTHYENYLYFMEGIKNNVIYNVTYDDLKEVIYNEEKFIHSDNLSLQNIKESGLLSILSSETPSNIPYVKFDFVEGNVIKIIITIYFGTKENDKFQCVMYKGNY